MIQKIFVFPKAFINKKRETHIPITLITENKYKSWIEKQPAAITSQINEEGFNPKGTHILIIRNVKGQIKQIYGGVHDEIELYDLAEISNAIQKSFSEKALKKTSFEIKESNFNEAIINRAHIGWGLAAYKFELYKKDKQITPALVFSPKANKERINAYTNSIALLKNMINTPANDMGPDEMEASARKVAKEYKAKIKVIKDKQLLEQNYPLIFAVGDSSPRRPRLIEIKWGNTKHKKLTLIGKGVVFDTGGLDMKPSNYMALMKKDMGGAAHALSLARIIMALKLPVNLRVLLPVVENCVSGTAFRPGDAMPSRKGLIVENKCTDAEGRLILADAITLASEDEPDLIIDFATLTGSARAALGTDIPAMFSNNNKVAKELQDISMIEEDPLWQMPLWEPYNKIIKSNIGDIMNSVDAPGDLIYSAIFLQNFLVNETNWIHIDGFAWESRGRAGRPIGGADTGLRSVFAFLEKWC
ncbi:MAG: leucyl aminopeptidase family protein [Alphaproteobacteria bacterium]|nr:leucyl aminopeptidase family protein [Alphaproteobacteria bacterium]